MPVARVHLHDLVNNGDVDHTTMRRLLAAMQHESRPVKPAALGVLGEAAITAWLQHQPGGATSVTYAKTAGIDDDSGRPFVLETAFAKREDEDDGRLRLVTGINWAPTLVDPFRALDDYGLSLDGLLGQLHLGDRPSRHVRGAFGVSAFELHGPWQILAGGAVRIGDAIIRDATKVTKDWTKFQERRIRSYGRATWQPPRDKKDTIKDLAWRVHARGLCQGRRPDRDGRARGRSSTRRAR